MAGAAWRSGAAGTSATGKASTRAWINVLARVVLATLGGYAASAGIVAALSATMPLTGMSRSEGVVLASMLGFIVYLVLLLWSFAERRLWRLGFVLAFLAGGGFGFAYLMGAGG